MNVSLLIADAEAKPRQLIAGAQLEMFRDVPRGGENHLLAVAVEVRPRTEVDVGPQLESRGHRVDHLQIGEVIRAARDGHRAPNCEWRDHALAEPLWLDPSAAARLGIPLHPEGVLA